MKSIENFILNTLIVKKTFQDKLDKKSENLYSIIHSTFIQNGLFGII